MVEPKILSSREFMSLSYADALSIVPLALERQLRKFIEYGEPLDLATLEITVKRSDKEHMHGHLEAYARIQTKATDG